MPAFETGTRKFFNMAAAPTGWTRDVSINESAIMLAGGGTFAPGGATNFTTVHSATAYSFTATGAGSSSGTTSVTPIDIPLHSHTGSAVGTSAPYFQAPGYASDLNYGWPSPPGPGGGVATPVAYQSTSLPSYTSSTLMGQMYLNPTTVSTPTSQNNGNHSHPFTATASYAGATTSTANMAIRYVDVLLATKNNISFSSQTATTIAKGGSVTFVFNTVSTGIATLYYSVLNTGFTAAVPDITGSIAAGASTTSITITIPNPADTNNPATTGYDDGGGSFVLELKTDSSIGGTVLARSNTVTVTEPTSAAYTLPTVTSITRPLISSTSTTATYAITAVNKWPRAGSWKINHITTVDIDFMNITSGSLVYAYVSALNFSAPINLIIGASKDYTNKTFTISFYNNKGVLIGTTPTVTLTQPTVTGGFYTTTFNTSITRGRRYTYYTNGFINVPGGNKLTWKINNITTNATNEFQSENFGTTLPTESNLVIQQTDGTYVGDSIFITPLAQYNFNAGARTFALQLLTPNNTVVATSPTITIVANTVQFSAPLTTFAEGQTATYNVITTGIADGVTMSWILSPVAPATSANFSQIQGTVTIVNNKGTFSVTSIPDINPIGSKSFTLKLYDSIAGYDITPSPYTTVTVVDIYSVSYNFINPAMTVREGNNVTLQFEAINDYTSTLYWTIDNISTVNQDFVGSVVSGTVLLNATNTVTSTPIYSKYLNSVTITSTALDAINETDETFTVSLRTGSITGPVVATSKLITIIDASTLYFVNPTMTIFEGLSATYTVNFKNVPLNTTFTWTINNITTSNADFSAVTGTFTNNSGERLSSLGNFTITTAQDNLAENDETFTITISNVTLGLSLVSDIFTVTPSSGQINFTSPVDTVIPWTVPQAANYMSVVCIGGGGGAMSNPPGSPGGTNGGGGGALMYVNSFPVTPGSVYNILVGSGGLSQNAPTSAGQSSILDPITSKYVCLAQGGSASNGTSGVGAPVLTSTYMSGAFVNPSFPVTQYAGGTTTNYYSGGAGKYTGIGVNATTQSSAATGLNGTTGFTYFGAGGTINSTATAWLPGLPGGVRIVWWNSSRGGSGYRAFPSTNVSDQ
jgi:hypothetical protein